MELGKQILDLREAQGITQTELARRLNTTQSAVARIEAGRQNVSAAMLKKISRALGKNLLTRSNGSVSLAIEGGTPLAGTVETNTSKNGAVALLCAALLNQGRTTLHRMPRIEEVHRLIEVLESLGVRVVWQGSSVTITPPETFNFNEIDEHAARKTRCVIMLIGALMHRTRSFTLPQTGGCRLGSRTVRPHMFALEKFGVSVSTSNNAYHVTTNPRVPEEVVLFESGDTVTENAIFAAARSQGTTTIKYASANYMVQEVCAFLTLCGVTIEGIGTTTLTITGVPHIQQDVEYTLAEDPTDSMFFLAAAAVTGASVTITRAPISFLELELLTLEKMGFRYETSTPYASHNQHTKLVNITTYPSTLTALPEKIAARPYPGLNIDNLPFFAVIATQASGQTLIHDWVYEKRAIYFTELEKLGAETVLADPHRIFISGKSALAPAELICPPALRPATILLIAMLAAPGHSILRNIYSINRGYEGLVERLTSLGARIEYLEEL